MKRLLMGAVALAALHTAPAMAQSAQFTVNASVTAACGALTGQTLNIANALNVDATGHLADSQSVSSTPQDVWCNGVNSKMTVAATPLTNQTTNAADTADFTRTINYTTDVLFAGTHFGPGNDQNLGATAGQMTVTASTLSAMNGKRPYAGAYNGTITVTLTPGA